MGRARRPPSLRGRFLDRGTGGRGEHRTRPGRGRAARRVGARGGDPVSSRAPRHPFDFATYPRPLNRALQRRLLNRDEYVLLVWLYSRANRSTWVATITLAQLAEAVAWDRSPDWLYRVLADLKRRRWIDYKAQPGKKAHAYAIKLVYDRPEHSEEGPSTQPLNHAGLRADRARMGPRRHLRGPSMEDGSKPLPEPVSESESAERLRAARDVRERSTTGTKDQNLSGGLSQDQILGSVRRRRMTSVSSSSLLREARRRRSRSRIGGRRFRGSNA
jgi:hypothetical protein